MRLLILAAVITLAYGHTPCPPLWTHLGEDCYRFFPDRLRWEDAKTTCGQFAPCSGASLGQLVNIRNVQANEFVKTYLKGFVAQPPAIDAWTGFSDAALEGQFVGGDGNPIVYTNWGLNQPDNGRQSTGQAENCVMISGETGLWFDASCAMMMPYICTMPAEPERPMFPRLGPPYFPGMTPNNPTNPGIPGNPNNPNLPGQPGRPI